MNDPVLVAVGDLMAQIRAEVGEAPGIVNRAVIVCETIDEDGDRRLGIVWDGNLKSWECRGMLEEVLADMNAYDVVSVIDEDD